MFILFGHVDISVPSYGELVEEKSGEWYKRQWCMYNFTIMGKKVL